MLRVFAEYIVPLLLPAVIYFAVQWWIAKRAAEGHPIAKPSWWSAPWPWLGVSGVALLLITIVVLSLGDRAPPGAAYHPPELEGGRVQPGGFDR